MGVCRGMLMLFSLLAMALLPIGALSSLFHKEEKGPGPGICSMYDICDPDRRLNCAGYRKAPILSDAKTLTSIKEWCGIDIANDHGGHACVSPAQWSVIEVGLKFAKPLLSPCPACWKNFLSLWCEMSVSPHQSLYVRVTETSVTPKSRGKSAVTALDYYITPALRQGLFASCANVSMGMTNKKVLDVMFCAEASRNPYVLFEMMGKNSTMRSPYLIRFPRTASDPMEGANELLQTYSGSTEASSQIGGEQAWQAPVPSDVWPLNTSMFPCDDPTYGCVCMDCYSKCPLPANWISWAPAPCTLALPLIGRSGCWAFGISMAYFFLIIVLCIVLAARLLLWSRQNGDGEGEDLEGNCTSHHQQQQQQTSVEDRTQCYLYKYGVEDFIVGRFYEQGKWVTTHIPQVLLTASALVILAILVLVASKGLQIERDPVKLWVGPHSQSAMQKQFYDENFGAFYRVSQVIIRPKGRNATTAITREAITLVFDLIEELKKMRVEPTLTPKSSSSNIETIHDDSGAKISLGDICYKPLGRECLIQSVALIWPTREAFEDAGDGWEFDFDACMRSPTDCLGSGDDGDEELRVPLIPELVVGGIPLNYKPLPTGAGGRPAPLPIDPESWIEAKSLVITLLLDPKNEQQLAACVSWESAFIDTLQKFERMNPEFTWAFSAESSVEWEINREAKANAPVVLISYLAMFLYVAFALGRHHRRKQQTTSKEKSETTFPIVSPSSKEEGSSMVRMRCTLAFGGVFLVAISILFSAAIFTLLHIKTTLIIAEVIPFLVLAVGVDNLFLLVQAYESTENSMPISAAEGEMRTSPTNPSEKEHVQQSDTMVALPVEERIALTLRKSGPSILVTELAELLAFLIGCNVEMPAVASFSMYAALAIACDIILQMTVFTAFLTLDGRRIAAGKPDPIAQAFSRASRATRTWLHPIWIRVKAVFSYVRAIGAHSGSQEGNISQEMKRKSIFGRILWWPSQGIAPILARNRRVQVAILLFYSLLFFLSLLGIGHIRLGLEQRLAVPSDSYLVQYFDALETDLLIGPPLFFVLRNANVAESILLQRALASRFYQDIMDEYSLGTIIEVNMGEPGSYLASGISNWFEDFLTWGRHCCQTDPTTGERSRAQDAIPCISENKRTLAQLSLDAKTLDRFLPWFLEEMPSKQCPFAGGAAYANQVRQRGNISAFKAYLQPLRSQEDFIASLRASRRIAEILTTALRTAIQPSVEASSSTAASSPQPTPSSLPEVFAFSPYFVFFDQYLGIIWISILLCTLCLLVIFVVTWAFLGSFEAALFSALCVGSTALSLFGVMGWWSIGLSAVSLVNVVIAMGISVEFSSNMVRAYMVALDVKGESQMQSNIDKKPDVHASGTSSFPLPSREMRVEQMVAETGKSVFFGITLTKLIGIAILYWSTSKIFEVFYFRMYIATVALAAFHGLVLLPVALARWGPRALLYSPHYR